MRVIRCESGGAVCREGTDRVFALLKKRPDAILGMATGNTMVPFYAEWVRRFRVEGVSFRRISTFNLDEYVGLPASHPASFRSFLAEYLYSKVDIDLSSTHVLDGCAKDLGAEGRRYEEEIRKAGGIDLQLLGIGQNGHIGFNEPGSPLDGRAHVVELAASTIAASRSAFPKGEEVPRQAVTIGVATILEARSILLLATGASKAEAIVAMVEGPQTAGCPASALQRHPNTTVLLDAPAARLLKR